MKKLTVLVLLLCLLLVPACGNDAADGYDVPETHAGAIDPDKVKTVRLTGYNEAGEETLTMLMEENNLYIPLLATVYDTAEKANPSAERYCDIRGIMRMTDGSEIEFAIYTDDTMESNGAVLEGAKMRQFIYAFVPGFAPETTAPETTEPETTAAETTASAEEAGA